MVCSVCKHEIPDKSICCPYCGDAKMICEIKNDDDKKSGQEIAEEKTDVFLAIISFVIPVIGVIVFLETKEKRPKTAKASGVCAIIGEFITFIIIATGII